MNRESVKRYGVRLQSAHQLLIPNGRVITTTLLLSGDRAVRLAAECIFWIFRYKLHSWDSACRIRFCLVLVLRLQIKQERCLEVGATRSRCIKLMLAIDMGLLI